MRKNEVETNDNWLWADNKYKKFFDFRLYNYDVFEVDKDFTFLANLYFRIDTS